MSANLQIRYLPIAQEDLLSILEYIARDSPSRALKFVEHLDNRISLLRENPKLGRIPRHPTLAQEGYRVLIIEAYLVFYIARRTTIEIHRVIHGSRKLDHIV